MGLSYSGFTLNHLCLDFPIMAWVLYPPTSRSSFPWDGNQLVFLSLGWFPFA